jgi:ABC transporter substrate binding protein
LRVHHPGMDRRRFLLTSLAGAVATPLPVAARQAGKVHRIGILRVGFPPPSYIEPFRQGLSDLGYVEGQNIVIEYGVGRSVEQLPDMAAELIRLKVDVLVASGTPSVLPARNATRTIPVVFVAAIDPVAIGLVRSLARPGGNVTGLTALHTDLMGKRLELLKETSRRCPGSPSCRTRPIRATPSTCGKGSLPRGPWECSFKSCQCAAPTTSKKLSAAHGERARWSR